jgi:hypothetical protein
LEVINTWKTEAKVCTREIDSMTIDKTSYTLKSENFLKEETDKNKILLTDTRGVGMKHYQEWLKKNPATGYKKTTHFTILKSGKVFEHFPAEYYSAIFDLPHIDSRIISISLENYGWLSYDRIKKTYNNWCGDIYNEHDHVFMESWRNHLFWDSYTPEQSEALVELIGFLCDKYDINNRMMDDRLYSEYAENFEGILTKPNFSRFSTDVNPSLELDEISKKIEI